MKQILKYIAIPFLAAISVACQERYVTYSDAEYVMFADTLATYPVQQDVEYFSIPVVSTVTRDYDRTFGVEIIDKGSNAIEKYHYSLKSNTVTIKAGSVSKNITVTQKQKDALTITSNKVEIDEEGGEFTIEAKTNVSLTYEIEEG